MKKLLKVLLALTVCVAALCVTAAAAGDAAPTRVWGKVSPWEGEGVFLTNGNQDDPMNEVVLNVGDAPVVDAATGLPLDLEDVKEGDTLYAWIGPAATMSLPPQVFPKVVVGNVPEGTAAPAYYELTSGGWTDPAGGTEMVFSYRDEEGRSADLSIPPDAEVTPWLTRQIVTLEGIEPGSQILVWRNAEDVVTKVLVFPYAYRGHAAWNTAAMGIVNGEMVGVPGKIVQGEDGEKVYLLPLRAMAEAAGYSVSWDKNRGAVVQDENVELVFYAVPGEQVVFRNGEEAGISYPCVLENGVTYLPAEDLCYWLNLFFAADAE